MSIGKKIKQRREELGWSQRELCARMGYSNHSIITKIEAGTVDIPQSKIVKFSGVLGVSIAYLMGWEDKENNNKDIADIVEKLRNDDELLALVLLLCKLDKVKIKNVKIMIESFLK
jgi:transcriptional regulator with XRE-family HTH domain